MVVNQSIVKRKAPITVIYLCVKTHKITKVFGKTIANDFHNCMTHKWICDAKLWIESLAFSAFIVN